MNKEQQIIEWFEKLSTNKDYISFCKKHICSSDIQVYKGLLYLIFNIRNNYYKSNLLLYLHLLEVVSSFNICIEKYFEIDTVSYQKGLLIKKNNDYGNSFDRSIKKFGWIYLAIELDKKKNRLHNLLKSKSEPNYESIEDTLLDIVGYCVLALIYIDNNKE